MSENSDLLKNLQDLTKGLDAAVGEAMQSTKDEGTPQEVQESEYKQKLAKTQEALQDLSEVLNREDPSLTKRPPAPIPQGAIAPPTMSKEEQSLYQRHKTGDPKALSQRQPNAQQSIIGQKPARLSSPVPSQDGNNVMHKFIKDAIIPSCSISDRKSSLSQGAINAAPAIDNLFASTSAQDIEKCMIQKNFQGKTPLDMLFGAIDENSSGSFAAESSKANFCRDATYLAGVFLEKAKDFSMNNKDVMVSRPVINSIEKSHSRLSKLISRPGAKVTGQAKSDAVDIIGTMKVSQKDVSSSLGELISSYKAFQDHQPLYEGIRSMRGDRRPAQNVVTKVGEDVAVYKRGFQGLDPELPQVSQSSSYIDLGAGGEIDVPDDLAKVDPIRAQELRSQPPPLETGVDKDSGYIQEDNLPQFQPQQSRIEPESSKPPHEGPFNKVIDSGNFASNLEADNKQPNQPQTHWQRASGHKNSQPITQPQLTISQLKQQNSALRAIKQKAYFALSKIVKKAQFMTASVLSALSSITGSSRGKYDPLSAQAAKDRFGTETEGGYVKTYAQESLQNSYIQAASSSSTMADIATLATTVNKAAHNFKPDLGKNILTQGAVSSGNEAHSTVSSLSSIEGPHTIGSHKKFNSLGAATRVSHASVFDIFPEDKRKLKRSVSEPELPSSKSWVDKVREGQVKKTEVNHLI